MARQISGGFAIAMSPATVAGQPALPRSRRGVPRRVRAAAIGVIAGAWGAYLLGQWTAIRAYEWTLAPVPLIVGCLLAALGWVCLGLGWWQALQSAGGRLAAGPAFRVWISSLLWRYVPGNLWHLAGRLYLGGQAGESRARLLAASAIEQILTLGGACLIVLLCLPGWPAGRWLAAPAALGLAGSLLVLQPATGPWLVRRLGRRFASLTPPRPPPPLGVLRVLGCCAAGHLAAGLSLWQVAAAIGVPAAPLPLIGASATAWAIGYLSLLTPSGLGVREGALTILLTPFLGAPAAVLAGLLSRAVLMAAEAAVWVGGRRSPPYFRERLYSKKSGRAESQVR